MRVRGDAGAPVFSEMLLLRQVTPQIPTLLRDTFGGSLYLHGASSKGGRPLWAWQCTDRQARACLKAMLPFLIVKKAQAENCLALSALKDKSKKAKVAKGRGHEGAAARPAMLTDAMEALFMNAKAMNTVGMAAAAG